MTSDFHVSLITDFLSFSCSPICDPDDSFNVTVQVVEEKKPSFSDTTLEIPHVTLKNSVSGCPSERLPFNFVQVLILQLKL